MKVAIRWEQSETKAVKDLNMFDWVHVAAELDLQGHAALQGLLAESECRTLAEGLLEADANTIDLESIKQGLGALRRFRRGLPEDLVALRAALYGRLVGTANRWQDDLSGQRRYPERFGGLSPRVAKGHSPERSALSRFCTGEHWGLHRDLEGEQAFPLQVSVLLSHPDRDFSGGQFVMTEQRPRMQSRPIVVVPGQGDAIIFAADGRPVRGTKGLYRVRLKYAVSPVRRGERVALELRFDAAA
jgi:hypothetical protein